MNIRKIIHTKRFTPDRPTGPRNELMWMLELAGFQDVDVIGQTRRWNSEHKKEMIFVATKNEDK